MIGPVQLRRVAFLDVFAEQPLSGNGLAVVSDSEELRDEVMLAFARETRLSETSFVQEPTVPGAHYRNRIWTPGEELPFAGHPSLGTAVAVARWQGQVQATYTQETGAGLQSVEVHKDGERASWGGEGWSASMLQGPAEFGPELDRREVMSAVGLEPSAAAPDLPPQIASTGLRHAVAPVRSAEALARAKPDYDAIDSLLRPHAAVVLYLAWCVPAAGRVHARGFARIREIGEDPATGSAVGPLCAYLADRGGSDSILVSQGEKMGRPSRLEAAMEEEGMVRVSGSVIPLIEGGLELP